MPAVTAVTRTCHTCKKDFPLTREFFSGNGHDRSGNPVLKYSCRTCTRGAYRSRPDRKRLPKPPPEDRCAGRKLPNLPADPLLTKLLELVAQRNRAAGFGEQINQPGVGGIGTLCKRLGVAERTLLAWRKGERSLVAFDVADRIMTRLGWLWFDVYDERTVLLPDGRKGWDADHKVYGRTDWPALRKVEHDFTCEGCKACDEAALKSARDDRSGCEAVAA